LVQEWAALHVKTIRNLIWSLRSRCQAVIDSHGSQENKKKNKFEKYAACSKIFKKAGVPLFYVLAQNQSKTHL
jgi:hypothetical protein